MNKRLKTLCIVPAFWAGCFMTMTGTSAFADECERLNDDNTWDESMMQVVELFTAQKYDEAEDLARTMSFRCSRSPMLNYIQAKIQEEKNDIDAAKLFYQKASEYTYEFAVAPDTAKKIWYARYEAENPERTQGGVAKLRAKRDKDREALKQSEDKYQSIVNTEHSDQLSEYKALTWTGTGIGIAGVVLMGIGLGVAFSLDDQDKYYPVSQKPDDYAITSTYSFSLAMIGAGGALTVAGAVLAGIYGYKWTHMGDNEIAFSIAPNQFSLSMTF